MIKVTSQELMNLGAEPRVGAEFETPLLDLVPGRFRVARLSAKGAELQVVAWLHPNGSAPQEADIQRRLLFLAASGARPASSGG